MADSNIIGKWPSGRPIVRNPDGSISSHRNAIVSFDNDYYVIPTMFDGKVLSVDEAVDRVKGDKFTDQYTGQPFPVYKSLQEAEMAEKQQHGIMDELAQLVAKPRVNGPDYSNNGLFDFSKLIGP